MREIIVKRRKPWITIARCEGDQHNLGCGRTYQLNKHDIVKKTYGDICGDYIYTEYGFVCRRCRRFTPLHPSRVPVEIKSQSKFAEQQSREEEGFMV